MKKSDLSNKAIVITGASSGFGKGAALRFAEAGASVVLAARRTLLLEKLADECRAAGGRALAVTTDMSKQRDVQDLASAAVSEFGRIDVWINNAGVGALGPFERVPLAEHVQVIETNLLGTVYGSYFAYLEFLRQDHGILINVASELGRHTVPYYSSYTAAKHGVVGLSEALRQEIEQNSRENMHVCVVMPTAHDTPFFDHASNHTGHEVQAPKPLHDPENVVETLFRLALDPKDKEIVGADGIAKVLLKSLAPKTSEKIAGKQMHKQQMEQAPPAEETSGAVFEPMNVGTEVQAGRLSND